MKLMEILVVDDSAFIALVCKQTLEKAGHKIVGSAFDGVEGANMALQLKPDLVILDVALPKKNGFEVAKAILDSLPGTKILAISALEDEWVREKAIQHGCYDFLAKPFDTDELLEYIGRSDQGGDLKYG